MKSIRNKLLKKTLTLVLFSILMCAFIAVFVEYKCYDFTMHLFFETSALSTELSVEKLTEMSIANASEKAYSYSHRIKQEVDSISLLVDMTAINISYIYSNPQNYTELEYDHPSEAIQGADCIQWMLPEGVSFEGSRKREIYLLGNMESYFRSVLDKYPNVLSIYFTSISGVSIDCDDTAQYKPQYYDGRKTEWYTYSHDNKQTYISDPYMDSFGRGVVITIAVPVFNSEGAFIGSCGLDIMTERMERGLSRLQDEGLYAALISKDGVICSPEGTREKAENLLVFKDGSGKTIHELIYENRRGVAESFDGEDEVFCAYCPARVSDWMTVVVFSKDDLFEQTQELHERLYDDFLDGLKSLTTILDNGFMVWFMCTLLLVAVTVLITHRFSGIISDPIIKLSRSVEKVGSGDLDYTADIKTGDEIQSLSENMEKMTVSLKEYIENNTRLSAEKERITTELSLAAKIQTDMLPSVFPPFPERKEFDLFASMYPAKEVGGDFYDFFLKDEDHLALVIADVSGKGVPAAMIMMSSKILIYNCTFLSDDPAEILRTVNERLCVNNPHGMFVTVWLGILEISTGKLTCSNAGHEYPALRRKNGEFELIKDKHGMFIGVRKGKKYTNYDIMLEKGDTLFVYTDGVPEATDSDSTLFGEHRMISALNKDRSSELKELLTNVKTSVDEFVGDAPQFDDLTMLTLSYYGGDP